MVQLNILSGKTAGSQQVVRRFPFHIGRAAGNELQLDDDGVWDRHLTLEFVKSEGFVLATAAQALATVNGHPVQSVRLRNGDIISFGSVKMRFWLAAARQRALRMREWFVWAVMAAITAGQFVLIYRLIR
jgi:pSer/pThr/pTyr-binding forkhead associated (FHA) protein